MIDYTHIRGEIPIRDLLADIDESRHMLHAASFPMQFGVRPITDTEIRSLKAGIDTSLALVRKVLPDLKAVDTSTLEGRKRFAFITKMQRECMGEGLTDSDRKSLQLEAILEAVISGSIELDEAEKIMKLLTYREESVDGMPQFNYIPVSDIELKNRLIKYGMMN